MRSFISVDLDDNLAKKVADLQKDLPKKGVRPVKPESLHFTLKFLGDVDDDQAEVVKNALTKISSDFSPISINIRGLGAFPSDSYIRVVWLGVEENDEFMRLHKNVQEALNSVRKDDHEPVPHLTIARVSSESRDAVRGFLEKNKDIEIGQMAVKEAVLKKSTLAPGGAVHDTIRAFDLRDK